MFEIRAAIAGAQTKGHFAQQFAKDPCALTFDIEVLQRNRCLIFGFVLRKRILTNQAGEYECRY